MVDPVQIDSDRVFSLAASPEAVWSAIGDTGSYQRWWPWLRRLDAHGLIEGDIWRCLVKPPAQFGLRFTLLLLRVEPGRLIVAAVDGDIRGVAELELTADGSGCAAHLTSTLAPANPILRMTARLVAPLAGAGHDWVLDTGAHQSADQALGTVRRG